MDELNLYITDSSHSNSSHLNESCWSKKRSVTSCCQGNTDFFEDYSDKLYFSQSPSTAATA